MRGSAYKVSDTIVAFQHHHEDAFIKQDDPARDTILKLCKYLEGYGPSRFFPDPYPDGWRVPLPVEQSAHSDEGSEHDHRLEAFSGLGTAVRVVM